MPYLFICRNCHYITVSRDKNHYLEHLDKSHNFHFDKDIFDIFVISENEFKQIKLCMTTKWFWNIINTITEEEGLGALFR